MAEMFTRAAIETNWIGKPQKSSHARKIEFPKFGPPIGHLVSCLPQSRGSLPTPMDSTAHLPFLDDARPSDTPSCFKFRFVFVALCFTGLMNVYIMRVNLSVAVIPMQEQFGWSDATKGLVLSTFFIGYLFGQIPGGAIATKFGGMVVFGVGVLATAALTLLVPLCATGNLMGTGKVSNLPALYALRIFMGLFESVTYPALYALLRMWAPEKERSTMVSITFAGSMLGTVVAFPISSWLVKIGNSTGTGAAGAAGAAGTAPEGGWIWVFYAFGALGFIWFLLWCLLVRSSPELSRCISEVERDFIIAHRGAVTSAGGGNKATSGDAEPAATQACCERMRGLAASLWDQRAFLTHPASWAICKLIGEARG